MRLPLFLATTAVLALAACSPPAADTAPEAAASVDPASVTDAIHQAESAQIAALGQKDLAGATAVYAEDAQLYVSGSSLANGRAAIEAAFKAVLTDPAYAVSADEGSGRSWVAASGDLAATSFTGSWTRSVGGKPVTDPILNQTVWRKQADGSWKIASDFNAVYAPAAAPAAPAVPAAAAPAPAAPTPQAPPPG